MIIATGKDAEFLSRRYKEFHSDDDVEEFKVLLTRHTMRHAASLLLWVIIVSLIYRGLRYL